MTSPCGCTPIMHDTFPDGAVIWYYQTACGGFTSKNRSPGGRLSEYGGDPMPTLAAIRNRAFACWKARLRAARERGLQWVIKYDARNMGE